MNFETELNKLVPNQEVATHNIAPILDMDASNLTGSNPIVLMFMGADQKAYIQMLKAMSKVADIPRSHFMAGFLETKPVQLKMLPLLDSSKFAHKYVIIMDNTFTGSDEYLLESAKEGQMPLNFALRYIEKHKGKYIPELLNRVTNYILFS